MRVLVVDDDPVGLTLARSVVESLGHLVHVASDGEQAWQLLVRDAYDVLLTDREMPGLDGLELCQRLRARSGPAGGPGGGRSDHYCYVVLLSAHDSDDEALQGLLAGADDYLSKPLKGSELRRRLLVAQRVTDLHLQLDRQRRELAALGEAQHELARTDALTLLPNRRALQEHLARLDAQSRRYARGYSVGMLDVDHFKSLNDAGGHAAGDAVLRAIAEVMGHQVRQTDGLYRYGGEEFVHVLDTASPQAALAAVERLAAAVRGLGLPHPGRPGEVVTVSGGVATWTPELGTSVAVLEAADSALYAAKLAGRARTRHVTPAAAAVADAPTVVELPDRGLPAPDDGPLLDPAPLQQMHDLGASIGRPLAAEVVQTWLRESQQRSTALQGALDRRDEPALRALAHTLKGSCATIGAVTMAALCDALEHSEFWPDRTELVHHVRSQSSRVDPALLDLLDAMAQA